MNMKRKIALFLLLGVVLFSLVMIVPAVARSRTTRNITPSDVKVTIQWAAYDNDHAVVNYLVEDPFGAPEGYLPITCPVSKAQIVDKKGQDISGSEFTWCRPVGAGKFEVVQFYYHDFHAPPAALVVTIGNVPFIPVGNGKIKQMPFVGKFTFTDIFHPATAISLRPKASVEHNGVTLQVRRVDLSPALIRAEACLHLPSTQDWTPEAYLRVGKHKFPADEWMIPHFRKDPRIFTRRYRCYVFLFYTDIPDFRKADSARMAFGIDTLHTALPECVDARGLDKIRTIFTHHGLQPRLDSSGYYCYMPDLNDKGLSPADKETLWAYVQDALSTVVHGPWEVSLQGLHH